MSAHQKNLLIVEDGETINKMLNILFTSRGYKVSSAKNGIDALGKIKEERPDLILLDLMMPEMDGFEFCETLKKEDKFQEIPVIVISVLTDQKHKDRLQALGVNDYIEKPFVTAELVEKVLKVLS